MTLAREIELYKNMEASLKIIWLDGVPGWLSQLNVQLLISARSWSQGPEIQPQVGLHAGPGACLRFSPSSLRPSPTAHALSPCLSLKKIIWLEKEMWSRACVHTWDKAVWGSKAEQV